jgi:Asp-tRNA(Asn)/Glu-tRNA(Gln) amidotransferase A subunit family amidase
MSNDELTYLPASRLAELIRSKQVSSVEATQHFLERIDRYNPRYSAFITVAADQALAAAKAADDATVCGNNAGRLHGVPIAIKDLSPTKGIRTTYGSLLYKDWVPDADDIPTERIRAAGGVILGKTNTPEFGWKGTTENMLTDPCRNPWDDTRTSGGSSGGSGVAVAAALAPLAGGSDAGGSIRIPASFCGVYGIKPTFGRVPTSYDGPGGWRSLAQNGPITNTVEDAALLLSVLAGPNSRDATCIQEPPPDFMAATHSPSIAGLRVAWSPTLDNQAVDPQVRKVTTEAAKTFEVMGASVVEASPEYSTEHMSDVFRTLMLTDLAVALGPAVETQRELITPLLAKWVSNGMSWPATRLASALRELEWHKWRLDRFFEHYDLLLTPAMAVPAFPIEEFPAVIDGVIVDRRWGFTPFLYPFNMGGQPAASVPCGFTADGLPVGLQIVGPRGAETRVLQASAAYEAAHPWTGCHPVLDV